MPGAPYSDYRGTTQIAPEGAARAKCGNRVIRVYFRLINSQMHPDNEVMSVWKMAFPTRSWAATARR